jgi:hypothetical protein
MGAPFYDPAGNIVYEGAGGQIEMDHKGIRFIRKADNVETFRVDTETGDAFFKGDITGASGTFSGNLLANKVMAAIITDLAKLSLTRSPSKAPMAGLPSSATRWRLKTKTTWCEYA